MEWNKETGKYDHIISLDIKLMRDSLKNRTGGDIVHKELVELAILERLDFIAERLDLISDNTFEIRRNTGGL